jgi:hypothetical protein
MYSTRDWIKLWLISILAIAGCGLARAQQPITVAMVTQFSLSGIKQVSDSSTAPIKIANKDILAALNSTGRFNFGTRAQLLLLSVDGNLPNVAVREGSGTNTVTTDISDYFFITELLEVHAADHLAGYALWFFNFDNHNGTSFNLSGMVNLRAGTINAPGIGILTRDKTLTSTVSGSGVVNGANFDVRGSVHGGSAKAEID